MANGGAKKSSATTGGVAMSIRLGCVIAVAVFVLFSQATLSVAAITVVIPATADIGLAGQPSGTIIGGDNAPTHSPIAINISAGIVGQHIPFAVTGSTSRDPDLSSYPLVGGDGETPGTGPNAQDYYFWYSFSLSRIEAPFSSFVGVFIDSSQTHPVPDGLHFGTPELRSFAGLSPELQQIFFIGDGLTGVGTGEQQLFQVPQGADRLYLGILDIGGNYNNVGELQVTVAAVPEPSSILVMGGAFAMFGIGSWWRQHRSQKAA
jgi:hypothetical protein